MDNSIALFFADPTKATLLSILFGAAITWFASWRYYKKAGDELKRETTLLKRANMALVYMLEHPEADIEVKRDGEGNPIAVIVSVTARGSVSMVGKAHVSGGAENS